MTFGTVSLPIYISLLVTASAYWGSSWRSVQLEVVILFTREGQSTKRSRAFLGG